MRGVDGFERPVVLVDMDGVLVDFDRPLFEMALDAGIEMDIADISESRHRFLTDHCTSRDGARRMRQIVERAGFFAELPPMPGAVEGMAELVDSGVEIWICTKPLEANPTCRDDKGRWLREYLPDMERRMILAPDKSLVLGTVLLDDAPHVESIGRAVWRPVLFESVWHQHTLRYEGLPSWSWGESVESLLGVGVGSVR